MGQDDWELWGTISKALGITLARAKKLNPTFTFKVKNEYGMKNLYGKKK